MNRAEAKNMVENNEKLPSILDGATAGIYYGKNDMEYGQFTPIITSDSTETFVKAANAHNAIRAHMHESAKHILSTGKHIKAMKDESLYTEFGYASFEEYTVKALGIKQRQAYTYIGIYDTYGEEFLQSNANIGVTKLDLLTKLGEAERAELLAENSSEELAKITVKELETLIADKNGLQTQVDMFSGKAKTKGGKKDLGITDKDLEKARLIVEAEIQEEKNALKAEKAEQEKAFEAERKALTESQAKIENALAEERTSIEKQKAEIEAEKEKAVEQAKKKLEKEAKEKANSVIQTAKNEAKRKAEEEANKQITKLKETNEALAKQAKEAEIYKVEAESSKKEKEALEKQMKASSNPALVKFKFEFEKTNEQCKALMVAYHALDGETQAKLNVPMQSLSKVLYKQTAPVAEAETAEQKIKSKNKKLKKSA